MILREEDVGSRDRVTTDEERVARGGDDFLYVLFCVQHLVRT